jgi:hypothetical protein
MTINYIVKEEDYLQYLLYSASKNKSLQSKVLFRRILLSFTLILCGLLLLNRGNDTTFLFFIIAGILTAIFYSKYASWRYKSYYLKEINKKYSKFIGKPITITLNPDSLYIADEYSNSTLKTNSLDSIIELVDFFILKFHGELGIAINKNHFSSDQAQTFKTILIKHNKVPFRQEPEWYYYL